MARDHDRRRPAPALVLPGFPGTKVAALGHAGAGSLAPPARADHVHDADPGVSSGSGLTNNRFLGIQPVGAETVAGIGTTFFPTFRVFASEDPTAGWDAVAKAWTIPVTGWYQVRFAWTLSGKAEWMQSTIQMSNGTADVLTTYQGESTGLGPNQPSQEHHLNLSGSFGEATAGDTLSVNVSISATVNRNLIASRLEVICLGTL